MKVYPKKRDFRPRAHCNPFGDKNLFIPTSPEVVNWGDYYSSLDQPKFVDIGCGYGKFLINISKIFPDINIIGMEIRKKVVDYVSEKISIKRETTGDYFNVNAIHTNAMIFLPNFFSKASLQKIFVLFPDPQFKKRKRKARIVSKQMGEVYSYLLDFGGRIYISTDVQELFEYMVDSLSFVSSLFRLQQKDCELDPLYVYTYSETDESKRAAIKTGKTYSAIFEKRS